jgi:NADP-dependent 3-hydroxy acid dehydrogenase YdfG
MTQPETVVVTGATSGVGRAIAERFARDGAHVALLARGEAALAETARTVERLGGTALAIATDVADAEAVETAAVVIEETFGEIDIWINNAMTTVFAFLADIEPDEFRRATEVTYLGSVWGTMTALRRMTARDRGTIVQVGSALAYRGIPLQAAYCGAKHASKGFFESVRSELLAKQSRVHVTMVQLPGLNTPQFDHCRSKMSRGARPIAPIFQPEVAATAIHWAAHHRRREVYVGGSTLYTILGNKLFPGLGDHYLSKFGVDGQLTGDSTPTRDGNLVHPSPGTSHARGRFDDEAHGNSLQVTLSKHRRLVAGVLFAGALLTVRRRG